MSGHRIGQQAECLSAAPTSNVAPEPSESRRDDEQAQVGYWPIDKAFPALLTDAHLREVLGVSWATFYRLKKLQRFRDLIARPVLTRSPRYSGLLVQRWASGQWTQARTFGAARQRQQAVAVLGHGLQSAADAR